jgi:pimeloyl-ACP methyl ester carboxylesterase
MWDAQFQTLSDHFRVIRYDLRGYGRSSLPAGAYTPVEDLRAVLDFLGVENAALVCASFGSSGALELAVLDPTRVDALAICPPGIFVEARSEELGRYDEAEDEALDRGDVDAAVELNLQVWVAGPSRTLDDVDRAVVERVREMQRRAFEVQLPAFAGDDQPSARWLLERPWAGHLGSVECPTLVIVGEHDVGDILSSADLLVSLVPDVRSVVLPDAAHMVAMEEPDEVTAAIAELLGGIL